MAPIKHITRAGLIAVATILSLCGCRSYDQDPYPVDQEAPWVQNGGAYKIFDGDRLKISFKYHQEWNVEVTVRPDGRMSVPFVGEVKARKLSLAELDAVLEKGLAAHIKDPDVDLDIVAFHPREVYVGGEVNNPGIVTFEGARITLLEAIMKAGGPIKGSADMSNVILARDVSLRERKAWKVNLDPVLTAKVPSQPVHLMHHDVILLPNNKIDQANVFIDKYINQMIPGGALTMVFIAARDTN